MRCTIGWLAGFAVVTFGLGGLACGCEQQPHHPKSQSTPNTTPSPGPELTQIRQLGTRIIDLYRNPGVPSAAKHEYNHPPYSCDVTAPDGTDVVAQTRDPNGDTNTIEWVRVTQGDKSCDFYFEFGAKATEIGQVLCDQNQQLLFSVNGNEVQESGQSHTTIDPVAAQRHTDEALKLAQGTVTDVYRSLGVS
jgi:hypothetical protein